MTGLAIIGCGFVAHYYMLTLSKSQTLRVVGVLDKIEERASTLAKEYNVPKIYRSLGELTADPEVQIVVNLTDPRSHYETTLPCLQARKHVFSEKPLAMTIEHARELAAAAEANGVQLSCAPSSMLGEAAQTAWKAIRDKKIGEVRLAYAELDDELVHKHELHNLKTPLGSPWPAKDEFEVGCTIEHAGYYTAWLAAMFGPAKRVTAFAADLIPDKFPGGTLSPPDTADFTVACIEFRSGVVARLTCSIVAPHDHSLRLIGDEGVITVEEAWNFGGPVRIEPREWNRDRLRTPAQRLRFKAWRKLRRIFPPLGSLQKVIRLPAPKLPLVRPVPDFEWSMGLRMDFSRGIQELADAVRENRPSRLSTHFSLHLTELALAIQNARAHKQPYEMTTAFDAVEPMAWAR